MNEPSFHTVSLHCESLNAGDKMLFWIIIAFSILIGFIVYLRQNSGQRLGGPIAPAKALWLYWTISVWFFLIPYILFTHEWQLAITWGFGFLTLSMWVRGLAELYMLFVSKNWTPKIGITHDLLTIVLVCVSYLLHWESLLVAAFWVQIFAAALVLSLIVETYYAYAFLELVKEKTKGDDGIWYANKDDPEFKKILNVTTFFNWVLYLATIQFIYFLKIHVHQ